MGALITVGTLDTRPVVRQTYPTLSVAASAFAGVQIRNLATVGGNDCNASPAGDTLPALRAFDAQCRIVGPFGERTALVDQFFTGPGSSMQQRGEILAELRLPPPTRDTGPVIRSACSASQRVPDVH